MTDQRKPSLTRRDTLKGIGAGLAAAAVGSLAAPAIAQQRKLKYTLSWLPTGQFAYVYMAKEMGFWKKRGLDVEISRGYGGFAAIQSVVNGQFDIGGAATSGNLVSVLQGLDIKIVGTQAYDSTMGFLVPENGPIKTGKDLAGKRIAVTAAGGDTPFLPAYAKIAGIDPASVTTVSVEPQSIEQSVMSGRVDGMIAFGMSSIPNFITQKFPVRFLSFKDAGLTFYWMNSIVRGDLAAKEPTLVTDLNEGLFEGLKYTILNPEEASERHLKLHPEIAVSENGKLFTDLGVGMIASVAVSEEAQTHSLGYSDPAKVDKMAEVVRQYLVPKVAAPPPVDSYLTNKLIGNVTLTPAEWDTVKTKSANYGKLLNNA